MITKKRKPYNEHFSRTHRDALDWLYDKINLDPKIRIKYIDTENQLGEILIKEISHVMSGNIFCVYLTIAFSVLQIVQK